MKWVTRERPKTDRIACPWLILNFIDPDAEFLYVPADEVLKVAEREGGLSYEDMKDWLRAGGTLITIAEASRWVTGNNVTLLDTALLLRDGRPDVPPAGGTG